MTEEQLRAALEVEQTGYLWTTPHTFTPRLVRRGFGDGRRLMGLTTINNRPAYWIVRVDSRWDCGFDGHGLPHDAPCISEFIDEIIGEIEDEYGRWDPEDEFYWDCQEAAEDCRDAPTEDAYWGRAWEEFPRIDTANGCSWFGVYWPGSHETLRAADTASPAQHPTTPASAEGPPHLRPPGADQAQRYEPNPTPPPNTEGE